MTNTRTETPALAGRFVQVVRENDGLGMVWNITISGSISDEEAMAITFQAEPKEVVLGEHVNVIDAEGTRIGHIKTATYFERAFGPAYVIVGIHLR